MAFYPGDNSAITADNSNVILRKLLTLPSTLDDQASPSSLFVEYATVALPNEGLYSRLYSNLVEYIEQVDPVSWAGLRDVYSRTMEEMRSRIAMPCPQRSLRRNLIDYLIRKDDAVTLHGTPAYFVAQECQNVRIDQLPRVSAMMLLCLALVEIAAHCHRARS